MMSKVKSLRLMIAGAALALPASVFAGANGSDTQQLLDRIAELEGKVASIEAVDTSSNWLSGQGSEEIRALIYETVADASTRTSLQNNGATSGWDESHGFHLCSDDGNFDMSIWGAVQFRYVYDHRDAGTPMGIDDADRAGFELARTGLGVKGQLFDPSIKYVLWGNFNRNGGTSGLMDATLIKKCSEGWAVQFGQFKTHFYQEFVRPFTKDMFVERSLVNSKYAYGRSQGVELSNTSDQFRFFFAVTDGIGQWQSAWNNYDTEFAFVGRLEWLAMGEGWGQFGDSSAWPGTEDALMLGAAATYQSAEYGTGANNNEAEILRWTLDGAYRGDGWNIFATAVGNHTSWNMNGSVDTDEYAIMVQGGVFVADDVEIFGRYEWGDSDGQSTDDLSLFTAGFSKFFHGNAFKWTTDVGYSFEPVTSFYASAMPGWQMDDSNQDGQMVFRTQLQWTF